MTRLSVNVNKIATLRNSRGGAVPSVVEAAKTCVAAGAGGITVHPREDQRHITPDDVRDLSEAFRDQWGETLEYNIEGDPRPDWVELVRTVQPHQATLVPVTPGEVTSNAGWQPEISRAALEPAIDRIRSAGIRISLFVEADEPAIRWAKTIGAHRIELYTEPYARACERGDAEAEQSFLAFTRAATLAHDLGLGVNAGHDLDLDNLPRFATLPHLDEVSIGHAIVSRAVFVGLATTVEEYAAVLRDAG